MARKIIISGGGTGGHIFPALAIANEVARREPDADIQFVGAKGGMEMTVVPKHGYPIQAVWISGIHRRKTLRNLIRNLSFPLKLIISLSQAMGIVNRFKPDAVVGVGGFASGPVGRVAAGKKVPLFICEQNAYPGLVNRWLAPKATKVLLGNGAATKYFPSEKVVITGNPIRNFKPISREAAIARLGLDPQKPVVLSMGGSLGAKTLNDALQGKLEEFIHAEVQLLWQCGKRYVEELRPQIPQHPLIHLLPFIDDMEAAYAAADLVIARAGGSTLSELIALSKPAILVPSPNVAEDHQTQNARSLVEQDAAWMVADSEAREKLVPRALEILQTTGMLEEVQQKINQVEKHEAAQEIVDQIFGVLAQSKS